MRIVNNEVFMETSTYASLYYKLKYDTVIINQENYSFEDLTTFIVISRIDNKEIVDFDLIPYIFANATQRDRGLKLNLYPFISIGLAELLVRAVRIGYIGSTIENLRNQPISILSIIKNNLEDCIARECLENNNIEHFLNDIVKIHNSIEQLDKDTEEGMTRNLWFLLRSNNITSEFNIIKDLVDVLNTM